MGTNVTSQRSFFVRHKPAWHDVDLEGDPGAWARETIEAAWRRTAAKPPRKLLRAQVATLARLPREYADHFMVLVHIPAPADGIGAIAAFTIHPVPADLDMDLAMAEAVARLEGGIL